MTSSKYPNIPFSAIYSWKFSKKSDKRLIHFQTWSTDCFNWIMSCHYHKKSVISLQKQFWLFLWLCQFSVCSLNFWHVITMFCKWTSLWSVKFWFTPISQYHIHTNRSSPILCLTVPLSRAALAPKISEDKSQLCSNKRCVQVTYSNSGPDSDTKTKTKLLVFLRMGKQEFCVTYD